MSAYRPRNARARRYQAKLDSRRRRVLLIAGAVVVGLGAVLAIGAATANRPGAGSSSDQAATGDVGPMGGKVVKTPGKATGVATAAGVEVTKANWALGRVPLMVTVTPTWTLRNTSSQPVTLGEPKPEVVKGCCPGPLTLGATTLAPGTSTTLDFPLQMHAGMDGPHDLRVHVPVQPTGADPATLALRVTGDFRD